MIICNYLLKYLYCRMPSAEKGNLFIKILILKDVVCGKGVNYRNFFEHARAAHYVSSSKHSQPSDQILTHPKAESKTLALQKPHFPLFKIHEALTFSILCCSRSSHSESRREKAPESSCRSCLFLPGLLRSLSLCRRF